METYIYDCNPGFMRWPHFTNKERDTESGNDYFEARYLGSSMGLRYQRCHPKRRVDVALH